MKTSASVFGVAVLVAALTGAAGDADTDDQTAAIRQRIASYVTAYNQHDAAGVANLWAENAVYIQRDTGERIQGRAAIADMFRSEFDDDNTSKLVVTVESIRLITPDVAIEDGSAEITSDNEEA